MGRGKLPSVRRWGRPCPNFLLNPRTVIQLKTKIYKTCWRRELIEVGIRCMKYEVKKENLQPWMMH